MVTFQAEDGRGWSIFNSLIRELATLLSESPFYLAPKKTGALMESWLMLKKNLFAGGLSPRNLSRQ